MVTPLYFGRPERPLFGMLHRQHDDPDFAPTRGLVVAPPLLQEGIGAHRALWWLGERVAPDGITTLRFDWHGSGDSSGTSDQLTVGGLVEDMQAATDWMQCHARVGGVRQLALRSGCLVLLAAAARSTRPVDLVLWDPVLDGARLVQDWRRQHREQLAEVGRYLTGPQLSGPQDLIGFDVAGAFLDEMTELDVGTVVLPAGSRILVVGWHLDAEIDAMLERHEIDGIEVQQLLLDSDDRPGWEAPLQFEDQAFPRRGTSRLAQCLGEAQAWG